MRSPILSIAFTISSLFVFAADSDEEKAAQVYDVKITVKTTVAKKSSLSAAKNPFLFESGTVIYRKQASQSWVGLIWGCDCESIRGQWEAITPESVSGCVIWNAKSPYNILFIDDIHWRLLNAIDATGTKCEGAWTIGDSSDESAAFLSFAGFGTLGLSMVKEDGALTLVNCTSNVKSISGNVSGWMPAPSITTAGKESKCTFCGIVDPGTETTEDMSEAWNFCECADEIGDNEFTAVSGTWSIKYNKKLSQKLVTETSILKVYKKFPENVKNAVSEKIDEVSGK